MKALISLVVGMVCLLAADITLYAEEDQSNRTVMMDAVVVTARKIDQPSQMQTGDVDKEITPVMTTTIQREAFEGKTENIAEIIEKEVGVQVRQAGGLGSFSSVSLRGSSSDQVLVFMDGILLNDASGGGVDLSTISLSDVAAIDIYRGAAPINYGSASIGGVVNIRTLRSKKGLNTSVSGGYGSFNSRKLNAFINHKPERFDYLISADYLAADNDFEIVNDNGTKWNPNDDRNEKRNNAQVEQTNLLAKAGYDASDTLRLSFMDQLFHKDQGIPSWNNSPLTRSTLTTTRNIATLQLIADDLSPWHLNTNTQLSYTWKEEEYDDRGGHIGLAEQHNTYTTNRTNADLFVEWLGDWQDLIGTFNLLHETYASKDHLDKSNPRDSQRDSVSIGLQDSILLFDESLIITPAARHTWIEDKLEAGTSIWGSELTSARRSDNYLTPQIGLVYGPLDWLKFKSNLAQYVRQPSFFELFGDRGLFIGNPDLKKETGLNFDIGTQCQWATPSPWLQRLSLNAAYFHTKADDLITRVYDARGIGQSANISGALIRGVEFSGTAEFLDHFRAVANYTRQDPRNQSEIEAFDGMQLPGRFINSFLGRLEVRFGGITLYGEYVAENGTYYDTANLLPAADKNELNAGVSWTLGSWMIWLEGKNLTDEHYEDFNGFALPGRSFLASVKYAFSTPKQEKRSEP
jgi:iron complex outermembrane receptor protein